MAVMEYDDADDDGIYHKDIGDNIDDDDGDNGDDDDIDAYDGYDDNDNDDDDTCWWRP
jgi:hypothetical protein